MGAPKRDEFIDALFARLLAPLAAPVAARRELVFNPALAQALALDPAATALKAEMTLPMAVDSAAGGLFRVTSRGTLLVSPALLARPHLLGLVLRWAQEAAFLVAVAGTSASVRCGALASAWRHGAALVARLNEADKREMKRWVPSRLWSGDELVLSAEGAGWLAQGLNLGDRGAVSSAATEVGELALPLEQILEAGGDGRIASSPATGMNRYGAASRPRPEAVHFSSSTASSVSDYGFAALDRLRRVLLTETLFRGSSAAAANAVLADAIAGELLAMLSLRPDEADVVLTPSGTDAELVAVLLALAASEKLANILVSPEESGRAVRTAAEGRYFHDGTPIEKNTKIWREADIEVESVGVRDATGRALARTAVEEATAAALARAKAAGRRPLLHVLLGSKTGISAPSAEFLASLGLPSGAVDVVGDSCQWRVAAGKLGDYVRAGWMAQVSGSKFFTGPAFSGALIAPSFMRSRRADAARLLDEAPWLKAATYWSPAWREAFAKTPDAPPSFGPLMRWAGALIEAALFRAAEPNLAARDFDAFCLALAERLAACRYLMEMPAPHPEGEGSDRDAIVAFAGRSIICFAPRIADGAGGFRRLDVRESELLFRRLNADLSGRLGAGDALESALAAQPMHIGQPVDLTPGSDPPNVILRLVIGARFFSTIAMAGEFAEAALDAEIADALRALDKAELILARWGELEGG